MRRAAVLGASVVIAVALGACQVPGTHKKNTGAKSTSVFSLAAGECVAPPTDIKAEITKVTVLPCTQPHSQETFAIVRYDKGDVYPGDKALRDFADGACLEHYEPYVGTAYTDSSLFYTYLLPSARGWSDGKDRSVVCLVTTTGAQLTSSIKGSGR